MRDRTAVILTMIATALALVLATPAFAGALGVGLPGLPALPLGGGGGGAGGGGGGGGGGGTGGGGPGGGGTGGGTIFGGSPGTGAIDLSGATAGSTDPNHANDQFGNPLATNLFGNDTFHASVKYFGQSGANRTEQAVGIGFTFSN